ncbi:MAG: hypothetical protein QOI56_1879, partial [Actinomycetota bacterium]|nr:hypothetical protein [Actinomycetota bacterium]
VVWDAPGVAKARPDGSFDYSLRWMRLPDHAGDTLDLSFELPAGWSWKGDPPPTQIPLDRDIQGSWVLQAGS